MLCLLPKGKLGQEVGFVTVQTQFNGFELCGWIGNNEHETAVRSPINKIYTHKKVQISDKQQLS